MEWKQFRFLNTPFGYIGIFLTLNGLLSLLTGYRDDYFGNPVFFGIQIGIGFVLIGFSFLFFKIWPDNFGRIWGGELLFIILLFLLFNF